jgi:hypothetical protein
MSDSNTNPMGIDLREAGLREFSSIQELAQWCEREQGYWKWLDAPQAKDPEAQHATSQIRAHIQRFYARISQAIGLAKATHDGPTLAVRFKEIKSAVEGQMADKKMVFSERPEAKFLDGLRQTNPRLVVYATATLLDVPYNAQSRGALEGSFLALAYRHGLVDRTESERSSLEALHAEWSGLLAESKTTSEDASREYDILRKQGADQLTSQKDTWSQFKQSSEADFAALLKTSGEKLQNIERTYDEKLALQSAVVYWERKAAGHWQTARRLSWASGIVGACAGLLLGVETFLVIGPLQRVGDLLIWKGAMLLLTAVLGVWAVRILVRLLLSNLHLQSDADERRTMLLTYLALLRSGQGPTEAQRELILQILFRPSATGIVKDDGLPPAVAQWLNLVTSN